MLLDLDAVRHDQLSRFAPIHIEAVETVITKADRIHVNLKNSQPHVGVDAAVQDLFSHMSRPDLQLVRVHSQHAHGAPLKTSLGVVEEVLRRRD